MATLIVSQNKQTKELTINLNGEAVTLKTEGRVKYLRVDETPVPITINSIESLDI
jgi:hypothetical protein